MSRVDELICELCPEGVVFKQLNSLAVRNSGTPVTAGQMKLLDSPDGDVVVYAAGNTTARVKVGDLPSTDVYRGPSIVVKSRGYISVEFVNHEFSHKSELWSYTFTEPTLAKFLFFWLQCQVPDLQKLARSKSVKLPQLSVGDTDLLSVPVPPVEVQEEIVRILDTFTSLEAELKAEIVGRQKQTRFYQSTLLEFSGQDVPVLNLESIARIRNGSDWKNLRPGNVPVYGSGGIMGSVDTAVHNGPSVLIPRKGSLGNLFYVNSPFWTVDTCFYTEVDETLCIPKFLYYTLITKDLASMNLAGGVPSLTQSQLNKVAILLPGLEQQQQIVEALDKMHNLVDEGTGSLASELAARRRQFEHYRNTLLTFKELV